MKIIGLIGGTSWYSTIDYYRYINEGINQRLGGHASAKILLYSVNFSEIVPLTVKGDWDGIADIIIDAAKRLELAGADCVLLCANTMHLNAVKVQASISIPLIHIADVTVSAIKAQGLGGVLLLGTKYTMLSDIYLTRLRENGIEQFIPGNDDLELVNSSIFDELGKGIISPQTKHEYLRIIDQSVSLGAKGIIMGCTEIPLLLQPGDCSQPLLDTTRLHSAAAVDFALG
ncbi:MAG: aspartate/glutamate racemase family protein [Ferruginibacter sp.]